MRFFPVACFICCAVASVWTVSLASHWANRDVIASTTLEAFVLSRSLIDMEGECANMSSQATGFSLSGFFPPSVNQLASAIFAMKPTKANATEAADPRYNYSLRRHNVAFHPVYFDDIYSIDKRGNTLHFIDDATSIAKLPYPLVPALRKMVGPLLQLLKLAIPVGINIAQSTS